eukprot:TRINITY_DN1652_c0_g2_i1.p1 TRINITY_DN1652_c0_g2~~TRINITY_DN1652_c0_g2_i1.p1  ORF type:complete len:203 (+),score=-24.28 TRINITY_DN1652_c0_g2_i1:406-1014(+)
MIYNEPHCILVKYIKKTSPHNIYLDLENKTITKQPLRPMSITLKYYIQHKVIQSTQQKQNNTVKAVVYMTMHNYVYEVTLKQYKVCLNRCLQKPQTRLLIYNILTRHMNIHNYVYKTSVQRFTQIYVSNSIFVYLFQRSTFQARASIKSMVQRILYLKKKVQKSLTQVSKSLYRQISQQSNSIPLNFKKVHCGLQCINVLNL